MRKICKKLITIALGAVMVASVASVSGCKTKVNLGGDYSTGNVVSNGGFVVEKGNFIYFINGVDDYTATNEGEVVKASLMRIATADFKAGDYSKTELVVPSLMVAADYTSGIYIYGDRVYYATPTNAKNTSGEVENSYLDFKSTRLDGKDTIANYYFRSSSNSALYRFTEVDGVVYCMHMVDSDVYSYNTSTKEDTLIAKATTSVLFDSTTTESARVYYTMEVDVDIDTANTYKESYNQVYTATADAKVDAFDSKNCSYTVHGNTFSFDADYLEEKVESFDVKDITTYPYVNLGELVLDGKGKNNVKTPYNEITGTEFTPSGYKYTLVQATNDGIYYSRSYVDTTESTGDGGWLLYTATSEMTSVSWNAIEDNFNASNANKNDVIAYDTTNASATAIFYIDNGTHYYLYNSGAGIYRNESAKDGSVASKTRIVNTVASPTLVRIEDGGEFNYLYYTVANTNGNALYRAVYDGTVDNYNIINKDKNYQPVKILNLDIHSAWYTPEIIENKLVFVNAESYGANSYNYVYVMDMNGANGMMTNGEIATLNDTYEDITTAISDIGTSSSYSALGNLMSYYYASNAFTFPTVDADEYYFDGTSDFYHSILADAADRGYSSTYLYSTLIQSEFEKVIAHQKGTIGDYTFLDENGKYYGTQDYFYSFMGQFTEDDQDAIINVWKTGFVLSLAEDDSLETWQWVLIGVGIGLGVIAIACAVIIPLAIYSKKKKARLAAIESAKPRKPRLDVDMTDDDSIDVYSVDGEEKPSEEITEISVEEAVIGEKSSDEEKKD